MWYVYCIFGAISLSVYQTTAEFDSLCLKGLEEICAHKCISTPGTFRCECNSGYTLMADRKSCKEDKCKTQNPCEHQCSDNEDGIKCSCNNGYLLKADGKSCEDIDECAVGNVTCGALLCINLLGSYGCGCPKGHMLISGDHCEDIDECSMKRKFPICPQNAECVNTIGSFQCTYRTGFSAASENDKDKCKTQSPCQHQCSENEDGIKCSCNTGYLLKADGKSCEDIDECAVGNVTCGALLCINLLGSYGCGCQKGYTLISGDHCEDIDECSMKRKFPICPQNAECVNTIGSFQCTYRTGFSAASENDKVGKNRCKPRSHCQHKCNDNGVEVECSCRRGYQLMTDGKSCKDVNECLQPNPPCPSYSCENTVGSYKCGTVLDDPAHLPSTTNSTPSADGRCPPGFRTGRNDECEDINECTTINTCNPFYQRCANTIGSYLCTRLYPCGTGYTLQARTGICEDIDECALGTHYCNFAGRDFQCENRLGSFRCVRRHRSTSLAPNLKTEYEYYEYYEYYDTGLEIYDTPPPPELQPKVLATTTSARPSTRLSKPLHSPVKQLLVEPGQTNSHQPEQKQPELQQLESEVTQPKHKQPELHQLEPEVTQPKHKQPELHQLELEKTQPEQKQPEQPQLEQITQPKQPELQQRKPEERQHEQKQLESATDNLPVNRIETKNKSRTESGNKTLNQLEDIYISIIYNMLSNNQLKQQQADHLDGQKESAVNGEGKEDRSVLDNTKNVPKQKDIEEPSNCPLGYKMDDLKTCQDIDECATGQASCGKMLCTNSPGGYVCSCPQGHRLVDGNHCEDIDECSLAGNMPTCTPNADCVNTIGSYHCKCHTGLRLSPVNDKVCIDVNECMESLPRSLCKHRCTNLWGTYKCSCYSGYKLNADNSSCSDIDECAQSEHLCMGSCLNEPGSFKCTCPSGYKLSADMRSCLDIDECALGTHNCAFAGPEYLCENHPGSFRCVRRHHSTTSTTPVPEYEYEYYDSEQDPGGEENEWTKVNEKPSNCQVGFQMDKYGACYDIDECSTNRHSCSGLTEICRNTMGGYLCDCAPGFRRDLLTGVCDIITTTSSTTSSTAPPTIPENRNFWGYTDYRRVTSRPFRPRTLCDVGYHLNSKTGLCEDINECTNGQANCADVEICVNTEGGYRCECPPNWKLDEVRHKCVPNRNNGQFPQGYGNEPVYPPAYPADINHSFQGNKFVEPEVTQLGDSRSVISCPTGYKLGYDNICEDIDECASGQASCGKMLCTNLPGGYVCSCPQGHRLVDGNHCEDVDECLLGGNMPICSQNADCVNTVGSYQCRCHNGFRSAPVNDKVCVDVDECTESPAGSLCQHRCNDVWGGYQCTCHRGYRLNADNRSCSDVDECKEFKSKILCIGRCVNEPGSYRCMCPPGYRLSEDKRSCIDIDECDTGEAPCAKAGTYGSSSDVCLNTRGGYRCHRITCPPGYKLENRHRCYRIGKVCPQADWECALQPAIYSYNFITFVSNLNIPAAKVDLFTMRGPAWPNAKMTFQLRLLDVNAPPTVKEKADINAFLLVHTGNQAVTSLVRSLQGPQSIELELSMELYNGDQFRGTAVAKLYIYVSEYEF